MTKLIEANNHRLNKSLSLGELEKIVQDNDQGIWVELLEHYNLIFPAILDHIDGSLVAVWCAYKDGENGLLYAKDYKRTWLAYKNKPI